MPNLVPADLTPEMLNAGIDSIIEMIPAVAACPRELLGEMVQNVWTACSVAHGRIAAAPPMAHDEAVPAMLLAGTLNASRASPALT